LVRLGVVERGEEPEGRFGVAAAVGEGAAGEGKVPQGFQVSQHRGDDGGPGGPDGATGQREGQQGTGQGRR
jgi:hypothetical protein